MRGLAFGISSCIAGLAGTLIGYRFGSVSGVSYGTVASLTALAVAYLGGITSVSGFPSSVVWVPTQPRRRSSERRPDRPLG